KRGTMRLGLYPSKLTEVTMAHEVYGTNLIYERHRHRWEFNNKYRTEMVNAGLVLSGTSPDDRLVEIVELKDHPWFVGCQFHPEFKSRPTKAHPLFKGLIKTALELKGE
ncbi:glutamine amidotransferase-related protein, partial [Megasphaera sp.]|uniref:glutamine amidotransferase-related protein n=1 Tax=Megasphaera sp. TaxID=2023260 RepID=UPI00402A16F3